jgi:hypothetical protein
MLGRSRWAREVSDVKKSICAVLLTGSAVVLAGEPQQIEPPTIVVPPAARPDLPWMSEDPPKSQIGELLERMRQRPQASHMAQQPQPIRPQRPASCYFIRMLRPVLPEGEAQRSGFIPLQAHVMGTVQETTCAGGGKFQPLIPARLLLLNGND